MKLMISKNIFSSLVLLGVLFLIFDFIVGDVFLLNGINIKYLIFLCLLFTPFIKYNFNFNQFDIIYLLLGAICLIHFFHPGTERQYLMIFLFSIIYSWLLSKAVFHEIHFKLLEIFFVIFTIITTIIILLNYDVFIKAYLNQSRSAIRESSISIFGLSIIFNIIFIYFASTYRYKKLSLIFLVLSIASFFISQSRGPLLAFLIFIIIRYFDFIKKYSIIILIGSFFSFSYLYSIVFSRGQSTKSILRRFDSISDALNMISGNPFGEGIGSYTETYNHVYPHNLIVHYLAELGYIFLFVFILLIIQLILIYKSKIVKNNVFFYLFIYFLIWFQFSGNPILGARIILPLAGIYISLYYANHKSLV